MPGTHPEIAAGITIDPSIHAGEPILAGTATTVRAIVELWQQGLAVEEIPLRLPHLGLDRVLEALHYYLNHRDEIDRHLAANRVPEAWLGRRFNPATGRVE